MPVPLQKGPLGLLGAFALKVLGRNPIGFGDTVVPVADVYDQYLATSELQVKIVNGATALATFNSQSSTVPQGRVWRVAAVNCLAAMNAADIALVSLVGVAVLSPNSAPFSCQLCVQPSGPGPGLLQRAASAICRPPLFLPSGWSLQAFMYSSGPITVAGTLQLAALIQEFDL